MTVVKIMLKIDDSYEVTNSKDITKYKMISAEKTIPRHITVKQKTNTQTKIANTLNYPKWKDFYLLRSYNKADSYFLTGKKIKSIVRR